MSDNGSVEPVTRRRRRSVEERRRIVAETFEAGASVAEVARRHGMNTNLLFKWRLRYGPGVGVKLVPAMVEPAALAPAIASTVGRMEIVVANGGRLIVDAGVDGAALARVLDVLEKR